ncbi:MAG TPA: hypothetical protein VJH22_00475 [Candidatus Nanoarchaeia archaeon]|nr:hypothetical protein [Candidatus Nanoarchaeia archaeon]
MVALQLKRDEFKKARGTWSRFLHLGCRKCEHLVAVYQKDGPGNLRRLYLDRIFAPDSLATLHQQPLDDLAPLKCENCQETLGTPHVYEKEDRKAFRLYQDAIIKLKKKE